jgi:putative ABC transport system permease protein
MTISAVALIISLSIRDVSRETMSAVQDYYTREVSVFFNVPDPTHSIQTNPPTLRDYRSFADSEYVQDFVLSIPVTISSDSLNAEVTAYAITDENSFNDFSYNQYVIIEGVFPTNGAECIVSSESARKSKLGIGDKLFVEQTGVTLSITGVFSDPAIQGADTKDYRTPLQIKPNDIITVHDFSNNLEDSYVVTGSFFLKSPNSTEVFLDELRDKGLTEDYSISFNQHRYQETMAEIGKSTDVIMTYSLIVILIGVGITFVMNLFAMRGRRYEIGVLRANGMPKGKVLCLLMGEMLILAVIATVIALIAGGLAQTSIIKSVLQMSSGVPQGVKDAIFSGNYSLTQGVITTLIGLMMALVVLSDSVTIGRVMRFDPIKILSERS